MNIALSVCIPNACTSTTSLGGGIVCASCQTGYSLTVNKSCILNFVNSSANSPTANTVSTSTVPNYTTPSLIISAGLIICALLWLLFKLIEQCKFKNEAMRTDSFSEPRNRRRAVKETSEPQLTFGDL